MRKQSCMSPNNFAHISPNHNPSRAQCSVNILPFCICHFICSNIGVHRAPPEISILEGRFADNFACSCFTPSLPRLKLEDLEIHWRQGYHEPRQRSFLSRAASGETQSRVVLVTKVTSFLSSTCVLLEQISSLTSVLIHIFTFCLITPKWLPLSKHYGLPFKGQHSLPSVQH